MSEKIGRELDRHTREFGTKKMIQIGKQEDNCITLLLGPRKTENHACFAFRKDKLWLISGTASSPMRVVQSLEPWAVRSRCGDTEFQVLVKEKDLLDACESNRWTRPRYRKGAVKNSSRNDVSGLLAELSD